VERLWDEPHDVSPVRRRRRLSVCLSVSHELIVAKQCEIELFILFTYLISKSYT